MEKLGHKVSYFILPVVIPFHALIILSFLHHFETLFQMNLSLYIIKFWLNTLGIHLEL